MIQLHNHNHTWRHISQVVFPFSLHHLCMQSLWANWSYTNALIIRIYKFPRSTFFILKNPEPEALRRIKKKGSNNFSLKKIMYFTLTVPEQAQGASKVLELSNSSSWQILQREKPESNLKSSTSKTTSSIFSQTQWSLFP